MEENFKFNGFPENMEIEIEDPKPKKTNKGQQMGIGMLGPLDVNSLMNKMTSMNPEMLKQILPDDLLKQMEDDGVTVEDALSQIKIIGPEMISDMLGISPESCNDCENCMDEEEDEQKSHPLLDTIYLNPGDFGSILIKETETLYDEFVEKYGTDSTKYLDGNVGVKGSILSDITSQLPFQNVKDLKFVESNERFLLFYAEPDIPDLYGFFVGFFKTVDDEFVLYVPEFGNTFSVDGDGMASLYKPSEDPYFFKADPRTQSAEFAFFSLRLLELAMYFVSTPQKKVLLSPVQFGTIKNSMPSVKKPSQFLRIGTITSNESPESILLKKDAELNLEEKKFPFYLKFDNVLENGTLQDLAEVFFKVNFNESELMKNSELRYTSDGRLYVNIDIGDI